MCPIIVSAKNRGKCRFLRGLSVLYMQSLSMPNIFKSACFLTDSHIVCGQLKLVSQMMNSAGV